MTRRWAHQGSEFRIDWADRSWALRLEGDRPGLWPVDGEPACLLGLHGVAEPGRWEPLALSASALVNVAVRGRRVEATYQPAGWHELTVRASWGPRDDRGMDLELQVQTRSVGKLRRVEVFSSSYAGVVPNPEGSRVVHPADARSAALTYDGREPDLVHLTTAPPGPIGPRLWETHAGASQVYAEWAHPQDATRRIDHTNRPETWSSRHGLFGHDLEKGFVLRARLRGFWLPADHADSAARSLHQAFLNEPPPLLT